MNGTPETCPACNAPKSERKPFGSDAKYECGSTLLPDGEWFPSKQCEEAEENASE